MAEPTRDELAYMRAVEIANALLGDGVPVIGIGGNAVGEGSIWLTFALDDTGSYAARLKLAEATPERFRELYEAVV